MKIINMYLKIVSLLVISLLFPIICLSQEISVGQGMFGPAYYQNNQKLTKQEMNILMAENPNTLEKWEKSNKYFDYGMISLGVELGFFAWFLVNNKNNKQLGIPITGLISSTIATVVFHASSAKLKLCAVNIYNENNDVGLLDIGIKSNGIELTFCF